MNTQVGLTGATGFVGGFIKSSLQHNGFHVVEIPLSDKRNINNEDFLDYIKNSLHSVNTVINCATSKTPKDDFDKFINELLPAFIQSCLSQKDDFKFIHVSSHNVLYDRLKDKYSNQKRMGERNLDSSKVIILRPGLIWSKDPKGNAAVLHELISGSFNVAFFPFPGNIYRPVYVEDFALLITNIIKNDTQFLRPASVLGNYECSLWDLALPISKIYNKKLIPIPCAIFESLPTIIKENMLENSSKWQQLLLIDRQNLRAENDICLEFNI